MHAPQPRVLVTGGTGFIAGHCILRLLEEGYPVRTTVRSLTREADVRANLGLEPGTAGAGVEVVAADLTRDSGWAAAVDGCEFVLHVASPVPHDASVDEAAVVAAAREGTLRLLRAARDAGVGRVVLTSAFHAIGFGHGKDRRTFTEDDWSVLDGPGVDAYGRSKILAERAAWEFAATEAGELEVVALNPVAVVGPVLGSAVSGANEAVRRILAGALPGYPDLWLPLVDVRDVAAAHVTAMRTPEAAGERFIVASGEGLTMAQIGATLKAALGDQAARVPTRKIPSVLIRVAALFDKTARAIVSDLGVTKDISDQKSRRVLGLRPRSAAQATIDAASSMLEACIVVV